MTHYLTLDDLVTLTVELGGLHVHDIGLLDSAANRPAVTVWGEDAYPDIHTKAAVLLESIARNHPLLDGNKRLSWVAAVVFYGINGYRVVAPEDDAYDLIIAVCESHLPYADGATRLAEWATPR